MAIPRNVFTYSPAADAMTPDTARRDGTMAPTGIPVFNANPGDTLTITLSSTAENVAAYGAFVMISSALYGTEASTTAGLNQARSGGPVAVAPAIEVELTPPNYSVTRTFTIAADALTREGTKITSRGWYIRVRQSTHLPPLGNFPRAFGDFLIKVAGAEQATIDLHPPVTELVIQPRDNIGWAPGRSLTPTLVTSGIIGPWSIPNAQNNSWFVTRWPGITKSEHVLPDLLPPARNDSFPPDLLIYAGGSTDYVTEAAGRHVGLLPYNTAAYDVMVRSDAVDLFPDNPMVRLEEWSNGERVAFLELPIRFTADGGEEGTVADNEARQTITANPATINVSQATQITARATVVLTRDPVIEDVVVTVTSDNDDIQVTPAELTFTPENWDEPQQIVITRAPDALDGDLAATVTVTDGADLDIEIPVAFRSNNAGLPSAAPGHRYQINGVLQSTDDPEAVSFEMDMAWAGESAFRDGAWRYLPGTIRPSVLTITPDMVIDVERCQIGPDSQDRINSATMQIAQDTSREYLPRRLAKIMLEDELALDGHEREIDMGARAFINNGWQAIRTLAVMMRRTRYEALYILRVRPGPNLERYHVHPGDIVTYTDARYNVYGSRCRVIASTINPDLSMTLSLRQESPGVYQDAFVRPGKAQGWQRLFKLPDGYYTVDMAALGDTVAFLPSAQTSVVGFNIDGSSTGTLYTSSTSRTRPVEGVTYTAADELAVIEQVSTSRSAIIIAGTSYRLDRRQWISLTGLSGSRTDADGFIGAGNLSYIVGQLDRAEPNDDDRLTTQPSVTPGGFLRGPVRRTDGTIIYSRSGFDDEVHAGGSRIFGWQPADENDANASAIIRTMAITTVDGEECLYALVGIANADNLPAGDYVYRRSDATSPDFPT